jgi:hypothetical protein
MLNQFCRLYLCGHNTAVNDVSVEVCPFSAVCVRHIRIYYTRILNMSFYIAIMRVACVCVCVCVWPCHKKCLYLWQSIKIVLNLVKDISQLWRSPWKFPHNKSCGHSDATDCKKPVGDTCDWHADTENFILTSIYTWHMCVAGDTQQTSA